MAIDWGKWSRADWTREPGSARKYKNKKTGEIISRHNYDVHYGSLKGLKGYRQKAQLNRRQNPEAILRPAPGRKKASALKGKEKREEIARRQREAKEAAAQRKIQSQWKRKYAVPKKIDLRNFRPGKISRVIELPIAYQPIEDVRQEAQRSGIVFAYMVGANLITEEGEERTIMESGLNHISVRFTKDRYADFIDRLMGISYAQLVSLFIHLSLKLEVARKRNKWKGKPRRV